MKYLDFFTLESVATDDDREYMEHKEALIRMYKEERGLVAFQDFFNKWLCNYFYDCVQRDVLVCDTTEHFEEVFFETVRDYLDDRYELEELNGKMFLVCELTDEIDGKQLAIVESKEYVFDNMCKDYKFLVYNEKTCKCDIEATVITKFIVRKIAEYRDLSNYNTKIVRHAVTSRETDVEADIAKWAIKTGHAKKLVESKTEKLAYEYEPYDETRVITEKTFAYFMCRNEYERIDSEDDDMISEQLTERFVKFLLTILYRKNLLITNKHFIIADAVKNGLHYLEVVEAEKHSTSNTIVAEFNSERYKDFDEKHYDIGMGDCGRYIYAWDDALADKIEKWFYETRAIYKYVDALNMRTIVNKHEY